MRSLKAASFWIKAFLKAEEYDADRTDTRTFSSWKRFAYWIAGGAYGSVVIIFLLVILLNPFGNFPRTSFSQVFSDDNQRYSYPSIVRSKAHRSAVFGTSTSRLLPPSLLNEEFEGPFANLSMDASTAWEQTQIARLFLRHNAKPKTIIFSLDTMVWCNPVADQQRVTFRLFPETFYDENPYNDFADILNIELWDALRKSVKMAVGSRSPYQDGDGFGDFTPGEENYDAEHARKRIHENPLPVPSSTPLSAEEVANLTFPALRWLDETLDTIPDETTTIIVRMPVNVTAQTYPKTHAEQSERECVRRIEAIAGKHGVPVYDMAFASDITTNDLNYWDNIHFRLPVGEQVVKELGRAYETGQSSSVLKIIKPQNR